MTQQQIKYGKGKKRIPRAPKSNVPIDVRSERQRILDDFVAPFQDLEDRLDEIVAKRNAGISQDKSESDEAIREIREEDGADKEEDDDSG